jgi:hypothetical protein
VVLPHVRNSKAHFDAGRLIMIIWAIVSSLSGIFPTPLLHVRSAPFGFLWWKNLGTDCHRPLRLTIGWLCLLAIVFGSAFGFKPQDVSTHQLFFCVGGRNFEPFNASSQNSNYGDRAISVAGLFVFQFCIWLSSTRRSLVPWSVSSLT